MDESTLTMNVILTVGIYVFVFLYCLTLFFTLRRIPKEHHQFPSWFVWLFLIPWIGFVFQWIMVPFGIPHAFKSACASDPAALKLARALTGIGIAQLIFITIGVFIHISPMNDIASAIGILLWVIYWILVLYFKRVYLKVSK